MSDIKTFNQNLRWLQLLHHHLIQCIWPDYIATVYRDFWQRKLLVNFTNHWWFANFSIQIFTISSDIYEKANKQEFAKVLATCQKFVMGNSPKFSPTKNSHYMVFSLLYYITIFDYIATVNSITNVNKTSN